MKHLITFEQFNQSDFDNNTEHVDEILGFSQEEKAAKYAKNKEAAIARIMAHRTKKATYLDLQKNHPERVDKYIEFEIKYPNDMYRTWDDAKKEFVHTGAFSVASGEGLACK